MAEGLDDGEFCLPPRFLTYDDLFVDKSEAKSNNTKKLEDGFGSGLFGFASDPSSPFESVVGSTETESDEEDYLTGLTRQMAHSTLDDGAPPNGRAFTSENPKGWGFSSSPQSTLCPLKSGCGCMQGSSRVGSTFPSRILSSPATSDLLYAAAEEVARMRMTEEAYGGINNRGLLRSPATIFSQKVDVSGVCPSPQRLSHQKLQAARFQILKEHLLMKQQKQKQQQPHNHPQVVQGRVRINNGINRPMGLFPSAWSPLQQQNQKPNGSAMRAVFLNNPTAKRECAGTGVFFPRRIGAPPEPRKKQAASHTVLLPARVVQALNLNLDEIGAQPQLHTQFIPNSAADTDSVLKLRSGGNVLGNQKPRNFRQQGMNHDVGLPQEWTY
ncbi:Adenine nucleotide alpha hydrolases-like superfamily protein isoform 1 [Hibiscus syriacus]|uniref:Adenine nucleotide alpha hydrolases-like superfamily protein isoform 1 n=1 Tax=Hibiscus syriacus TaxID=106335 RepID=A0A6A2ZYT3_HIBSY|nr:uncharacterized protein LOC120137362 [Hibiscus syriacus]KAE8696547.1 Adenine nucleotide alpha hydrolases-like superfamily protein isoform 1 [Hibiscus syriacus]